MDLSRCTIVFYLTNILISLVASFNTTTGNPSESQGFSVKEKDEGFPAWMVGVIVLSSIALIVLVATIIQRIMRRRAERQEEYRMAT